MSTKETDLKRTTNGNGHVDLAGLVEQTMLAGMGIANQGVTLLREAAEGVVKVADSVVDSTLDVATAWSKNTPVELLTTVPVDAARATWSVGRDTARGLLVGN